MKKYAYTSLALTTSFNQKRGWSLILLLFIMASFIASFPLIYTHLQTNSKVVSAYESWTKLQTAQELIPFAAKTGPITIAYPLPGYQTLNIVISPVKIAENPDETWEMSINSYVASSMSSFAVASEDSSGDSFGSSGGTGSPVKYLPAGFSRLTLAVKLPGDGSPEFPFAIASVKDLELLRQNPEENKNFVIARNIEFPADPDFTWTPIGTKSNPFKGIVRAFQNQDGSSFTISGLTFRQTRPGDEFFGLFGVVNGGRLENITLKNVNIDSRGSSNANTGSLVGLLENNSEIVNCYAAGQITGKNNVGGLVGTSLNSSIVNSKSEVAVGASPSVPAAVAPVAALRASVMSSIVAAPNTPAGDNVGGLVGYTNGSVTSSEATGNVSGNKQVGGLIGFADTGCVVTNSQASGIITATNANTGGLIGLARSTALTFCRATGSVTGAILSVGGLIGRSESSSITDSFASGNLEVEANFVGGLVGNIIGGSVTSSFASGTVTCAGTYYNAGGLIGNGSGVAISKSHASGRVTAMAICGGLAGYLTGSTVAMSYAEGEVIASFLAGGLIGQLTSGSVSRSYALGNTSGQQRIGGLIGENNGSISACYARGQTQGNDSTGGLIGYNKSAGTVVNSYSVGRIVGTVNAGGLIGGNFNVSASSGVTASYWNTQTAMTSVSAGGEGRTTTQMLQGIQNSNISGQNIYQNWINNDWHFTPNTEYPRLKNAYTMILTTIPGGTYQRDAKVKNQSTVTGFRMGIHEITQQQYMAVTGRENLSTNIGSQVPMQTMTWYTALDFCNRLSMIEGLTPTYTISGSTNPDNWGAIPTFSNTAWNNVTCNWNANGYRLATEDEWQWAAMGTVNNYAKPFAGSNGTNNILDYVWFNQNSPATNQQVGSKKANEPGLYDMSGNMFEMIWDRAAAVSGGARTDYRGPTTGTSRIVRGGDFTRDATAQTVLFSIRTLLPYNGYTNVGFRVVRKL